MEQTLATPLEARPNLDAPQPVFNCPGCSRWLPEGTIACPECGSLLYSAHLREIAFAATADEEAGRWPEARAVWQKALPWLPPGTKQDEAVQQRIALIDTRLNDVQAKRSKWQQRLGPLFPMGMTLLVFLSKAKFLLSFAGFFLIYWGIFGWKFGLGFAISILIHEMGHFVAAKRLGLKVDLPVFIPGLGAYVRWYSMGVTLEQLSGIALAGPFFGLLTAAAFGAVSRLLHEPASGGLFSALAHVTAWLNLLNLVPVFGLDGAQATYALNRMQRWLVLATSLIFFGWLQEYVFLFIALGMGWRVMRGESAEQPSTRSMVQYVLLLFTLGLLMYTFPDTTRRF